MTIKYEELVTDSTKRACARVVKECIVILDNGKKVKLQSGIIVTPKAELTNSEWRASLHIQKLLKN